MRAGEKNHINSSYNLLPIALLIVRDWCAISPRLLQRSASLALHSEVVIDSLNEKLVKSEMLSSLTGGCYTRVMLSGYIILVCSEVEKRSNGLQFLIKTAIWCKMKAKVRENVLDNIVFLPRSLKEITLWCYRHLSAHNYNLFWRSRVTLCFSLRNAPSRHSPSFSASRLFYKEILKISNRSSITFMQRRRHRTNVGFSRLVTHVHEKKGKRKNPTEKNPIFSGNACYKKK